MGFSALASLVWGSGSGAGRSSGGAGSVLVATGLVAPRTWGLPGSGVESMSAALAGGATREGPGFVLSPLHFQCQMHTKCSIKVCEINKRVNE